MTRNVGEEGAVGADPAVAVRYSRQVRLPQFGPDGQRAVAGAKVAVIGAGGLGSPVLTYLAAAGVGQLTVIDPDVVEESNLHRQVLHPTSALGQPKALSAAQRIHDLNPDVQVTPLVDALTVKNAHQLLAGYDLVIDGADNFPTRYLVSDACELMNLPVVWGTILGFAGQLSVFDARHGHGVTYRDLLPVPPAPGTVPSCAEAGVLGMLCGVIGSAMALEAVKVLTGIGTTLHGRVAIFDALTMHWDEIPLARDPGRAPVTEIEDVELTCGLPGPPPGPPPVASPDQVQPAEVPGLIERGTRIIDIREPHEIAETGSILGAEHEPFSALTGPATDPTAFRDAVLLCARGQRSASLQRQWAARGVQVGSVVGGFTALQESGLRAQPPANGGSTSR